MALNYGPKNPALPPAPKYPLLEALLGTQGLPVKATYTMPDAAKIFGVSRRTLENWVKSGKLFYRDLPGHARFLAEDLEDFLRSSKRHKGEKK